MSTPALFTDAALEDHTWDMGADMGWALLVVVWVEDAVEVKKAEVGVHLEVHQWQAVIHVDNQDTGHEIVLQQVAGR